MKIEEILKDVDTLNSEYHFNGCLEYILPFTYEFGGWSYGIIKFMGEVIWSEDNDERDYIEDTDEREPLYTYLKKTAEAIVKDLGKRNHTVNADILKQYNEFLDLEVEKKEINEFLTGYYE